MKKTAFLVSLLTFNLAEIRVCQAGIIENVPFYRTLLNLAFGGMKHIEEGIEQRGLLGFMKDWKTRYGALETLPSLAFDITADTQALVSNTSEYSIDQWQSKAYTIFKTGLAGRTLLPGYQQEVFTDTNISLISPWLVNDLRQAMMIFGKLSPQEIYRIKILPLNERGYENWDYVQMLWLGIVPTSTAFYVDETFLAQFRDDPLMYGFILAYSVDHYKKNTVRNRTFMNMVSVGLRTFIGMKVLSLVNEGVTASIRSSRKACEHHAPSAAIWKYKPFAFIKSNYKQAHQLTWAPYLGICGIYLAYSTTAWIIKFMIAEAISDFAMGFYDKGNTAVQKKLTARTGGSITPYYLTYAMSQWLHYYRAVLDNTISQSSTEQYQQLQAKFLEQQRYSLGQKIDYIKNNYFAVWTASEKERALQHKNSHSFVDNSSRLAIFDRLMSVFDRLGKTERKIIR